MAQIPTNRTQSNTDVEHVGDHNELHRVHNLFDDAAVTKGDLYLGTASTVARRAVGADDQVLTADSAEVDGVKWATPAAGGGGGGLDVFWKSVSWPVISEGVYIVDSTSGIITVTLPLLSSIGAGGYRVVIKRTGANYVDIDCAGADEFEPGSITTKRLFNDFSAISIAGHASGSYWYEFGFYGGVQSS